MTVLALILFVVAAVLFAVAALVPPYNGRLIALGLSVVSVGFIVQFGGTLS